MMNGFDDFDVTITMEEYYEEEITEFEEFLNILAKKYLTSSITCDTIST